MSEPVVWVENLGKRYRIQPRQRYSTLRDNLANIPARLLAQLRGKNHSRPVIWALKGVSFSVERGEVLGIIGRNGAGKTTLLRLLSRITRPTEGWAEVCGRVGSLLEIGTGFHSELTGRENIYLSAAILGMKRGDLAERFEAVVDFSGVEQFLDTPLKFYSSGMQTRLAFAVAAHLDPEILLVDEVLAVGDLEFQRKCLGKMSEATRGGRTALFVSHNLNHIRSICERCIWLDRGRVRADGDCQSVLAAYEATLLSQSLGQGRLGETQVLEWELLNSPASDEHTVREWGPVGFRLKARIPRPIRRGTLGIHLADEMGRVVWHLDWEFTGVDAGLREFILRFPVLPLRPGAYVWRAAISDGAEWSELFHLLPPLVVATKPFARTISDFHSMLNLPFEVETRAADPVEAGSNGPRREARGSGAEGF